MTITLNKKINLIILKNNNRRNPFQFACRQWYSTYVNIQL